VKWLTRIDVLTEPLAGEFQTGDYMCEWPERSAEAVRSMRVRARITDPQLGATIPAGNYTMRRKAWTGTGPITNVDISLTGEGEWLPAKIAPPHSAYAWQEWSFEWQADKPGRHTLRGDSRSGLFVRARTSPPRCLKSLVGYATLVVGDIILAGPLRPAGVLHGEGSAALERSGETLEDRRQPGGVRAPCSVF
jgi:hypothetical protein